MERNELDMPALEYARGRRGGARAWGIVGAVCFGLCVILLIVIGIVVFDRNWVPWEIYQRLEVVALAGVPVGILAMIAGGLRETIWEGWILMGLGFLVMVGGFMSLVFGHG